MPITLGDVPSFVAPVLPREATHAQCVHVAHGPRGRAEKGARFFAFCQDMALEHERSRRCRVGLGTPDTE